MSLKVVLVSLLFTLNTDLPKGMFEYTCCIKQVKKLFKVNNKLHYSMLYFL